MNDLIYAPSSRYRQEIAGKAPAKKKPAPKWKNILIELAATAVLITVSVMLFTNSIFAGANTLRNSYTDACSTAWADTYEDTYGKIYDAVEKKYHLSNRTEISISNIEKTAKLEVLKVTDTGYIVDTPDDNKKGITFWLEVKGEGTYVVDLQMAEFIVDNERCHVLVRVLSPELTGINVTGMETKLFKDKGANESYQYGTDFAIAQQMKAKEYIEKELRSNQYFYDSAETAARRAITNLVRSLNPGVTELTVEVEFTG